MFKYIAILFILLLSGCSNSTPTVKRIFQTENATHVRNNYDKLTKLLWEYKLKLDKRNPSNYSKAISKKLYDDIINKKDTITIRTKENIVLKEPADYLNYAFSKDQLNIKRNDYLIVGLYKMFYKTYKMDKKHKITAMSYNIELMQKTYKNMQILQWKIKHNKDSNNQYLFLTWQKNWQVELAKKINKKDFNFEMIKELHHIKTNKENLLDGSNSSFEILTSLMILYLHDSLKLLGAEPNKLSVDAIVGMVFMI